MDFIKITYTGRVKDGAVFDTTDETTAKKEDIHDDQRVYKPIPVVTGERQVPEGLDEVLSSMKVGDAQEVEVPPEKGFGARDPNLIRLVPSKVFKQQKITPYPGMPVELDGQRARVQTVSGGRVRVDFNHDLAGKTLVYDVTVEEKASSDKDKIDYLIERSFNDAADFTVSLKAGKAEIGIPEAAQRDKNLLVRKATLAADLFRLLNLKEVTYTETWKNPKQKSEEKEEGTDKDTKSEQKEAPEKKE